MVLLGLIKWVCVIFFSVLALNLLEDKIGVSGALGIICICVAYDIVKTKVN